MSPRYILILLIHFVCFGFFSYQFSVLISNYLNPGTDRLQTVLENKNLSQANISLVFKICYSSAYNNSVLEDAGYPSIMTYFLGSNSSGNGTFIGWGGQDKNMDVAGR